VLYFTCHDWQKKLFKELDPAIPVYCLEGGKIFRNVGVDM